MAHGARKAKLSVCAEARIVKAGNSSRRNGAETVEEIEEFGELDTIAVRGLAFKLIRKGKGLHPIKGTMEPGIIDNKHQAEMPADYYTKIRKTTTTKLSTGKSVVKYHLLSLSPGKITRMLDETAEE